MAATTNIERTTGTTGSPSTANVTSAGIRFSKDDSNSGTTAVVIPASGGTVTACHAVSLVLRVSAGTGSQFSNKRLYYSGSMPTGYGLFMQVEASSPATGTSYAQGAAVTMTGTTIGAAAVANVTVNGTPGAATGFVAMGSSTTGTVFDATTITVANTANGVGSKYAFVIAAVDSTATSTGNPTTPLTMPTINLLYDEA
jgi:hypothetical protein